MFIEIKTGKNLSFNDIKATHPNIAFPDKLDENQLYQIGYAVVHEHPIGVVYDPMIQALELDGYEVVDGKFYNKYKIVELSEKQIKQNFNRIVLDDISFVESQITPRRLRDAILTDSGAQWLKDKEAEIQALRKKLI